MHWNGADQHTKARMRAQCLWLSAQLEPGGSTGKSGNRPSSSEICRHFQVPHDVAKMRITPRAVLGHMSSRISNFLSSMKIPAGKELLGLLAGMSR
jgi:hypothetical protein